MHELQILTMKMVKEDLVNQMLDIAPHVRMLTLGHSVDKIFNLNCPSKLRIVRL